MGKYSYRRLIEYADDPNYLRYLQDEARHEIGGQLFDMLENAPSALAIEMTTEREKTPAAYPYTNPHRFYHSLEQLEAIRWDVKTNAVQRVEHVYRMPPMEYPVAIPKGEIRYTTARRMVCELARRAWYPFTAAASDEVRRGWRYD